MYGILLRCCRMDVQTIWIGILLCLVELTLQQRRQHEEWEGLSLKYGEWQKLPRTSHEAEKEGYQRQNHICKTSNSYHGFLYKRDDDTKALPIYDLNGFISGVQTMIPGNMRGYNSRNESIHLPPTEIRPPLLPAPPMKGIEIEMYTITAYFKHPKLVCNPIAQHGVTAGKGLYIQTGPNPIEFHQQIPLDVRELDSHWKEATCRPFMGTHYFWNISKNMACESIYPVFLMYDTEGKLGAFGWTFQGNPLDIPVSEKSFKWFKVTRDTFAFVLNVSQLPKCMFVPDFKMFGLHIWLQDHNSEKMLCPTTVEMNRKTTTPNTIKYTERPTSKIITDQKSPFTNSSGTKSSVCHSLSLVVLILSKLFQRQFSL